jgi:hypothetical protein
MFWYVVFFVVGLLLFLSGYWWRGKIDRSRKQKIMGFRGPSVSDRF